MSIYVPLNNSTKEWDSKASVKIYSVKVFLEGFFFLGGRGGDGGGQTKTFHGRGMDIFWKALSFVSM